MLRGTARLPALIACICVFLPAASRSDETLARLVERWPQAASADEELALLERMSAVIEASDADIVAELERLDAWAAGIASRLRAFAASASLERPPDELLPARAWWRWARSAGAVLPALGG